MQRKTEELQMAVQEYLDVDWTSVKWYLRRQIAKCVQECKSQASNAKKIARNLRHNRESHSQSTEENEPYDSDFDDWGSDFEDSEDEVEDQSLEVNNNSIVQTSPDTEVVPSGSSQTLEISQEKAIPKPPDISIVPKTVNGATIFRNPTQSTGVPRPFLKRPDSQPPPPPVSQTQSPEESQEDYEIPIISSLSNFHSSSSVHATSNDTTVIETYELVEAPEENYEIVDPLPISQKMSEKPVLPPRHFKCPDNVSPPPLPQKPLKLKEGILPNERQEGVKTFCRPKLPTKPENETQPESNPSFSNNIGFISTLMGRRPSATPSSSPKTQHKSTDGLASSVPNNKFLNGSLSSLSSSSSSEKDAQNMATRPLPPVPTPKTGDKSTESIQQDIQYFPWFQEIEREDAEAAIKKLNEPGSFVVRPSKRAGKENPYSLTVLHEGKLFHLNVRQRLDNTFALGKEKEKEKTFSSVPELIAYHQNEPILLKNRGEPAGKTKLCKYPEKT